MSWKWAQELSLTSIIHSGITQILYNNLRINLIRNQPAWMGLF
jgi:hypothetical protein